MSTDDTFRQLRATKRHVEAQARDEDSHDTPEWQVSRRRARARAPVRQERRELRQLRSR